MNSTSPDEHAVAGASYPPGDKAQIKPPKPTVTYASAAEWQDEAIRRFGPIPDDWKFRCPVCGRVYSLAEYCSFAGRDRREAAPQECIGRVNGRGMKAFSAGDPTANPDGCDYAAYGLFPLGDLVTKQIPGGVKYTSVNPFAEGGAK